MTEQEWLTTYDQARMWDWIVSRLTARQMQAVRDTFPETSDRVRCDLLREIIGNPFPGMSTKLAEYTKDPAFVLAANPEWLTWNDGTIGHMVQSILEEPCDECETGCVRCDACNMTGYRPRAEPRWASMPVLADALETAGCNEAAILDHLRDEEMCPCCYGKAKVFYPNIGEIDICQRCNGTGKRPVMHAKGCWALELLRGDG